MSPKQHRELSREERFNLIGILIVHPNGEVTGIRANIHREAMFTWRSFQQAHEEMFSVGKLLFHDEDNFWTAKTVKEIEDEFIRSDNGE